MRAGRGVALAAILVLLGVLAACTPPTAERATTVRVGQDLSFQVDVAQTASQRHAGLSGRASVPAGTGMLFIYQTAVPASYWMADMLVPIDLAWIRGGRLLGVQTLTPCVPDSVCPSIHSPGPVDAVLEVGAGALADAAPGAVVTVDRP